MTTSPLSRRPVRTLPARLPVALQPLETLQSRGSQEQASGITPHRRAPWLLPTRIWIGLCGTLCSLSPVC